MPKATKKARKVVKSSEQQAAVSQKTDFTIKDCKFVAVEWSPDSVEVLGELVHAICNITDIFKGSNVKFGSMISLRGGASAHVDGAEAYSMMNNEE